MVFVVSMSMRFLLELRPLSNFLLPLDLRHSRLCTFLRVTPTVHFFILQLLEIQILKQSYIDHFHAIKETRSDTARHAGAAASGAEVVRDGMCCKGVRLCSLATIDE